MKKGYWNGIPVIASEYIPKGSLVALDYKRWDGSLARVATQSGRLSATQPNIQNIPKTYEDVEIGIWGKCRDIQRVTEFEECNTCKDRFKCWTACRPTIYENMSELAKAACRAGITTQQLRDSIAKAISRKDDSIALAMFDDQGGKR